MYRTRWSVSLIIMLVCGCIGTPALPQGEVISEVGVEASPNGTPSTDTLPAQTPSSAPTAEAQPVSASLPPPTSCTTCILGNRGDILPFYQSNGWSIEQSNWNNVIIDWCRIDPNGCRLEKIKCTPCGAFSPANSCTSCIIDKRADILPFYQSNGWDTSVDNWDNIVRNWCSIDPVGCGLERLNPTCKAACKQNISTELITSLAIYLNDLNNWDDFVSGRQVVGQKMWDPIASNALPCQTYVSWIWYLSGLKSMETELVPDVKDRQNGWEFLYWYIEQNRAGSRWTGVIQFYDLMTAEQPSLVSANFTRGNQSLLESSLGIGDVVQYHGSRTGETGLLWKHSVLVIGYDSNHKPLVASFGTPRKVNIPWDGMQVEETSFDYDLVRAIHRPNPPMQ